MSNAYLTVFVEGNPNCPDGCVQRFKAEDAPRPVRRVRYWAGVEESLLCDVVGWSSDGEGTAVTATAITVEDSGSGTAVVVIGGDWGVRLFPVDGTAPFGEPYLAIAREDVLD